MKKSKLVIEYFTIVALLVGIFVVVGVFVVKNFYKDSNNTFTDNNTIIQTKENDDKDNSQNNSQSGEEAATNSINVAVFGVDKEGLLTDVMFVANFNPDTLKINLISLPRDTRVKIIDTIADEIRTRYTLPEGDVFKKLNSLNMYGGKKYGMEYAIAHIEDLLCIEIDNYVKVDLTGFKNIVDVIGGVEMEVPMDMVYDDPEQDLHIDLKAGYQTLDGEKAEQLVRYRKGNDGSSYTNGDVDRVAVQQEFLKAFAKKIMNMDNLVKNAPKLAYNGIKYVTTDFKLEEILSYIKYIDKISIDNINMMVLPGEALYLEDDGWYYIYDAEKTYELMKEYFK